MKTQKFPLYCDFIQNKDYALLLFLLSEPQNLMRDIVVTQ